MDIREESSKMHRENQGKIAVVSKVDLKNGYDLSLAYTPGVAEPCKEIHVNKDLSLVIGALRFVKKNIADIRIIVNGAGAAGTAIVKLLLNAGTTNVIMINSSGVMYEGMDLENVDRVQLELLGKVNKNKEKGNCQM
jgi:malic enzyme